MSSDAPNLANEAQPVEEPQFSEGDEVRVKGGMYTRHLKDEDGNPTVEDFKHGELLTLTEADAERSDANLIFEDPDAAEAREAEAEAATEGAATVEEEQPDYDELAAQLEGMTVAQAQEYLSDATFTDATLEAALEAESNGQNRSSLKAWIQEQLEAS
jgi:single-stranded DNA-binding protein